MKSPVSQKSRKLRIKKQIYELTAHDLEFFPIWEFKLDKTAKGHEDELTVWPWVAAGPVRNSVPGLLMMEDFQTRKTRTVL